VCVRACMLEAVNTSSSLSNMHLNINANNPVKQITFVHNLVFHFFLVLRNADFIECVSVCAQYVVHTSYIFCMHKFSSYK